MDGAICDLLEHELANKEMADKILNDRCPNCNATPMIQWSRHYSDELGSRFHCVACDMDYAWPIAWEPPLPVVQVEGKHLSPLDRRTIADAAKRDGVTIPDWWKPIMESDLEAKEERVIISCYICHKEKETTIITKAGYWHWKRGCHPRGWVDTDNGLYFDKESQRETLLARCGNCYKKAIAEIER